MMHVQSFNYFPACGMCSSDEDEEQNWIRNMGFGVCVCVCVRASYNNWTIHIWSPMHAMAKLC